MATIKELQEKIAKLEKGINSKATSTTAKAKMRTQVKNFKSDIADLKAKSKPTSSKVSKAKEISKEIKRKYSKSRPFGKSDIYQDAVRPAKPIGRRTSAEGNTYYEYRENRTDRKQPPKRYPRLENGGELSTSLKKRLDNAKEKYGVTITKEKSLKAYELHTERNMGGSGVGYELFNAKTKRDSEVLGDLAIDLGRHYSEMADGGYMAKGGTTKKLKVDDVVYNKRTKTIGIVRLEDERGETKTDADGNVNTSELQHYNPMKYPNQKDGKVAPSTEKEINTRGLWNPFKQYADGGMLNLLADSSGAGLQDVGGTSFSSTDLTPQMDITHPMFANGGETHRGEGGMYAKGGMTEHGLKRGDEIIDDQFWDNSIVVRNRKDGTQAIVYLSTGKRKESKM